MKISNVKHTDNYRKIKKITYFINVINAVIFELNDISFKKSFKASRKYAYITNGSPLLL
jgi:hypothetical protein